MRSSGSGRFQSCCYKCATARRRRDAIGKAHRARHERGQLLGRLPAVDALQHPRVLVSHRLGDREERHVSRQHALVVTMNATRAARSAVSFSRSFASSSAVSARFRGSYPGENATGMTSSTRPRHRPARTASRSDFRRTTSSFAGQVWPPGSGRVDVDRDAWGPAGPELGRGSACSSKSLPGSREFRTPAARAGSHPPAPAYGPLEEATR
jgi:hypothetical protein